MTSKIYAFTDSNLYAQAVRAMQAEVTVVAKGEYRAELTKIDLDRVWMQRGHETLARVIWGRNSPERAPITFMTRRDQAPWNTGGTEVLPGDIVFASLGASYHSRTTAETHWGSMSVTPDDLASASRDLIGRELAVPAVTRHLRPSSALMSRLLDLHREAGSLAEHSPEILSRPEVAHALEQNLLHVMVRCLAEDGAVETSSSNRRHAATLARLEELLAENCDRPLHLVEICAAVAVSERTLRQCCQEYLGMGPIRYLWLRRINLAHKALLRASPATTSVTEVATGHGFWELGRFSVAHRTLFGELPSATLARPPVDLPVRAGRPLAMAIPRTA